MQTLLRLHFVILLLNLVIVSCIFYTKVQINLCKYENIARDHVLPENYDGAVKYTNGFLIAYVILLGIQILGTILGLPFAKEPLAIGTITSALYILLTMPHKTIGYIWGVFCFIPFVFWASALIYRSVGVRKYQILSEKREERGDKKESKEIREN